MPNKCDDVSRLKRLEQRLDRQFSLFGVEFGLDGIIGLVPVIGDAITGVIGLYLILEARRLGARPWTVVKMLGHWGIDFAVGAIPIFGDMFDIAYKSNTKNVRLLISDLERRAQDLREINREALRAA